MHLLNLRASSLLEVRNFCEDFIDVGMQPFRTKNVRCCFLGPNCWHEMLIGQLVWSLLRFRILTAAFPGGSKGGGLSLIGNCFFALLVLFAEDFVILSLTKIANRERLNGSR